MMEKDSTALIIFVKNPIKGHVKTRLAKDIGDENALEVYLYLMNHTREVAKSLKVTRNLFYDTTILENDDWSSADFDKYLQYNGDLGERMAFAFKETFAQGFKKVVIVGSDCPYLDPFIVNKAYEKLEKSDVVIGPTFDGGYYMLGMTGFIPELFQKVPWSTEEVFETTKGIIESLGKTIALMPLLSDVDHKEDLVGPLEKYRI
ncbi:MAG: rSAM/selenodomain-associated transferase 1 [Sphingobacteriales bacterium]|jgi:rSAM/selenodomain-associated transferase 1